MGDTAYTPSDGLTAISNGDMIGSDEACCCGATPECPTNCDSCDDPLTVTISGFTSGTFCLCQNDTYTIYKTTDCRWEGTLTCSDRTFKVVIYCNSDNWLLYSTINNPYPPFGYITLSWGSISATEACPIGTYSLPNSDPNCSGQTGTAVVS